MTHPRTERRPIVRAAICFTWVLALVSCGDDDGDVTARDTTTTSAEVVPTTGAPTTAAAEAIAWATPQVSLEAASLTIRIGEQVFDGVPEGEVLTPRGAAPVDVHSDPGIPERYTTLEVTWPENGVEMRLFIYFTSDGSDWWSNEIRTYDGRSGSDVDWITYTGEFFRSPLGTRYTGDFLVEGVAAGQPTSLGLPGLRLQAFLS